MTAASASRAGADEIHELRVSYRVGDMWAPQLSVKEALLTEIEHFIDCIENGATADYARRQRARRRQHARGRHVVDASARHADRSRTRAEGFMIPFLDLQAQYKAIGPELEAAVIAVMRRGEFVLGGSVAAFEENFAAYCGAKHCVALNTGTSALHLALLALASARATR